VSAVLALAVAQIDVLSAAGVVNLANVDIDPDVLHDADKLGLSSLLKGSKEAFKSSTEIIIKSWEV
jgi:hypothetical protein